MSLSDVSVYSCLHPDYVPLMMDNELRTLVRRLELLSYNFYSGMLDVVEYVELRSGGLSRDERGSQAYSRCKNAVAYLLDSLDHIRSISNGEIFDFLNGGVFRD
jgi:hypothetical protein